MKFGIKRKTWQTSLETCAGPTGRKLSELPRQVFRKLQRDSQEATRRSHTAAAASHSRASPPAESAGTSSSHPAAAPSPAGQAAIRATPDDRTRGIIARAIMPRHTRKETKNLVVSSKQKIARNVKHNKETQQESNRSVVVDPFCQPASGMSPGPNQLSVSLVIFRRSGFSFLGKSAQKQIKNFD